MYKKQHTTSSGRDTSVLGVCLRLGLLHCCTEEGCIIYVDLLGARTGMDKLMGVGVVWYTTHTTHISTGPPHRKVDGHKGWWGGLQGCRTGGRRNLPHKTILHASRSTDNLWPSPWCLGCRAPRPMAALVDSGDANGTSALDREALNTTQWCRIFRSPAQLGWSSAETPSS